MQSLPNPQSDGKLWLICQSDTNLPILDLSPGPEGYPRVLDYSIFKSLPVPYSKKFTTRLSSRVVIISPFLSNLSNTQKVKMWNFCDGLTCHLEQQNVAITAMFISLYCEEEDKSWAPLNVEGDKSLEFDHQFSSIWMYIPSRASVGSDRSSLHCSAPV